MSYLVLARKWRPRNFDELVGQGPIARLLENSISQGRIAHAYVFSGPRGVGKTTSARILAKALNCVDGPTATPCGSCRLCVSAIDGSAMDIIEIDGASNNSVDDIRDLREQVKYAPSEGRYKIYIIDEAHMLSTSAFNALLKTLEEPPAHVIFVLATTDPRKIPLTVMSRCQHLPFRRISTRDIRDRLAHIAEKEGLRVTPPALEMLARAADGSMRDSLTLLDQVTSALKEVDEQDIRDLLGLSDSAGLRSVAAALLSGSQADVIKSVDSLVEQGADLRAFAKDLTKFLRDLLVSKLVSDPASGAVDLPAEELEALRSGFADFSPELVMAMTQEVARAEGEVRVAAHPRVAIEMALLRACYLSALRPVGRVIEEFRRAAGEGDGSDVRFPSAKESTLKKNEPVAPPAGPESIPAPEALKAPSPELKEEEAAAPEEEPAEKVVEPEPAEEEEGPRARPAVFGEPAEDDLPPSALEGGEEAPTASPSSSPPDAPADAEPVYAADDLPPLEEPSVEVDEDDDYYPSGSSGGSAAGSPVPEDGTALVERMALELADPRVGANLSVGRPSLREDTLVLTYTENEAAFSAEPLKADARRLEELASSIMGRPVTLKFEITKEQRPRGSERKERILNEPVVKDVLDLFDGRIVDIKARRQ